MIVNIVLENKTRVLDRLFSYSVPEELKSNIKRGSRVIVPFGRGNTKKLGIVVEIADNPLVDVKLKDIYKLIDHEPIISEELIDLALFMRDRYLSDLSSAFQRVLPPGNWKDLEKLIYLNEETEDRDISVFFQRPREYSAAVERFDEEIIEKLINEGVLKEKYDIKDRIKPNLVEYYTINKKVETENKLKNAPAQEKIFKFILENGPVDKKTILMETNSSLSSLKGLVEKGLVSFELKNEFTKVTRDYKKYSKISLNEEQQFVLKSILAGDKNKFLIHGITGSGKTEIYLQIVEEMLDQGKSCIILVPEISLTPQTILRFSGRFPGKVAVLHSKLNQREKLEQWQQIKNNSFPIVIGARSAIFAPVDNLGAIIIDEEHDQSYISDMNPKYVTREVGEFLIERLNAKLVLGSATPSIESYYLGEQDDYEILNIKNRATAGILPKVNIIDMREELKKGNTSVVGEELHDAIVNNLENKKQTLLFLNKRGHTSYVFCRRCGYVMNCDSCDVSMTYHKYNNILLCHQCGRTKKKPEVCPNCGSKYIREFGAGTEKLEEYCYENFPNAKIFRMDADTVRTRQEYLNVFEKMNEGKIDILIGTQMITKGFDFPNVTLVGVIAADLSLNVGSYKATETTFQLLTQVSGRAGRGDHAGEVFVQTYKPENYSIEASKNHDFIDFYNMEIEHRKLFKYPPFYTIFCINISGNQRIATRQKLFELQQHIQAELRENKIKEIEIIGPNPSPISRINNRYRFYTFYKYKDDNEKIKEIFKSILVDNKYNVDLQGFKLSLTFNPTNFI